MTFLEAAIRNTAREVGVSGRGVMCIPWCIWAAGKWSDLATLCPGRDSNPHGLAAKGF